VYFANLRWAGQISGQIGNVPPVPGPGETLRDVIGFANSVNHNNTDHDSESQHQQERALHYFL
jgi:hypothetical protein